MAETAPAANGTDTLTGSKSSSPGPDAQAAYQKLANGPAAQSAKDQAAKTSSEFSNLANARKTPAEPAATGQPLTHYHSFFFELLSWNNPRASAIAYASIVTLIFAARYLDILRYAFKLTWMTLGVTVAAEVIGKLVMSNGLATQLRPRQYYTIQKSTLDAVIGDVHELINFFVIEVQRILFAENVGASAAAAVGAFISYYLVNIVPYWGLALIATTATFFVPLIYTSNQELIDHHVKHAAEIVNSQTEQLRNVASKHTSQGVEITKQYMGDYTAKAQQMISGRSPSPETATKSSKVGSAQFPEAPKTGINEFPAAPKTEPSTLSEKEPLINA
ncbi:Reticulon-domain-containing protein [Microdochium trichocladiopsis]|uniref:Reticulon-like protein n=1 Tax=Microdochium trichocladiopsis TaxID=1682393 RepID=A0A9P8YC14_9PEZI|nr:Reticulon-domain-containing protein [Microdochium trichocladiopsis]KAH7035616.1 Reticulon-domain-containing protein [Microdochium trichocladiopsis]